MDLNSHSTSRVPGRDGLDGHMSHIMTRRQAEIPPQQLLPNGLSCVTSISGRVYPHVTEDRLSSQAQGLGARSSHPYGRQVSTMRPASDCGASYSTSLAMFTQATSNYVQASHPSKPYTVLTTLLCRPSRFLICKEIPGVYSEQYPVF